MIWHIDEQYTLEFSKVRFSEIENNNKDFVKNIQPVCLPSDTGDLHADKQATIVGWGNTGLDSANEDLNIANITILENNEESCQRAIEGLK